MVSDEGEFSMGHNMCICSGKAGLTKDVVFHKGGLSKEVLYCNQFC